MRWSTITGLLASAIGVTSCAYYDDYGQAPHGYGDYRYQGDRFVGRGAGMLDPWLASTPEGRDIVMLGFGGDPAGISEEKADRANIWFRRYADTDRDLRLTDEEIRIALVQASRQRSAGY